MILYYYKMPSEYQIETLTETILWKISNADLQEVYEKQRAEI